MQARQVLAVVCASIMPGKRKLTPSGIPRFRFDPKRLNSSSVDAGSSWMCTQQPSDRAMQSQAVPGMSIRQTSGSVASSSSASMVANADDMTRRCAQQPSCTAPQSSRSDAPVLRHSARGCRSLALAAAASEESKAAALQTILIN